MFFATPPPPPGLISTSKEGLWGTKAYMLQACVCSRLSWLWVSLACRWRPGTVKFLLQWLGHRRHQQALTVHLQPQHQHRLHLLTSVPAVSISSFLPSSLQQGMAYRPVRFNMMNDWLRTYCQAECIHFIIYQPSQKLCVGSVNQGHSSFIYLLIFSHSEFAALSVCDLHLSIYGAVYRYGRGAKIIHFLSPIKPWHCKYDHQKGEVYLGDGSPCHLQLRPFMKQWWAEYWRPAAPSFTQEDIWQDPETHHQNVRRLSY